MNKAAHEILDLSQNYIQKKGFGGFSYHHLANDMNIKTSTVHYY